MIKIMILVLMAGSLAMAECETVIICDGDGNGPDCRVVMICDDD